MAGKEISKEESLSLKGYRHACHIMLYADTDARLFGKIPMKHIVIHVNVSDPLCYPASLVVELNLLSPQMQMRFDGLLGFPGGLVNPAEESLERGLSRELWEEMGTALEVTAEDHHSSCVAPSPPHLITHLYCKRLREEELQEAERAAVLTAADHGLEVLGMVRVPLYVLKNGGGFPSFLSHSFISNSRSQLLAALRDLGLLSPGELDSAVACAEKIRHGPQP
ncbi:hypothetical protein JZ751_019316 [Albula glossodonta]|uniref:U8 snoRNA-decapping enzyme n=1 Tax=Albula glossodonta TaxID=121402 RepID=A0A8T2MTG7_9TELE|nr:hypothetical protein JZ751_019316 [Albula glossodonta]